MAPAADFSGGSRMNSDAGVRGDIPLLPTLSLALWMVCAGAGIAGMLIGYGDVKQSAKEKAPVQMQLVKVELPQPAPVAQGPPPSIRQSPAAVPTFLPPDVPPPPEIPAAPAIIPVAAASPAIALAVPMEGLTRLVDPDQANHGTSSPAVTSLSVFSGAPGGRGISAPKVPTAPAPRLQSPTVVHLVYGQGDGDQPRPDYPEEAALEHQEGTVTLRFTVDAAGRVGNVQVTRSSPWPLLNQAAQRAVRDTWHFSAGAPRIFDVPIQFQLGG